ncbi:cbb3-type cytochrome c oxidase N-terminal domain-containing protein [Ferruginibacter sp. SUN002]|uniref:cbb3-type cytochrome c oxidase N-terminal domain-containing protein n=1 Tax=Ferruginibacter sp. SUN002 TaxID=2937789 RepID=UPI003D36FEB7
MLLNYFKNKKNILTTLGIIVATGCMAQDAATTTKVADSGSNLLVTLLVITAIILAFVIWGMGQTLIALIKQLTEKNKNASKVLSIVLLVVFSFSTQISFAQTAAAVEEAKAVPNYGGLTAHEYYSFVAVIGIEIAAVLFLAFFIRRILVELFPEKQKTVTQSSKIKVWWAALDRKLFTKAIPVEKEADVMLDHDYDGIRELDNALPPWWKYGFYITVVVGFIYMFNFHFGGSGKNPTQEYAAEMEQARIEKEIYEAGNKDKIDEANVPMADATGLQKGKEIFSADCWACHGKAGEGGAGPNLTDDYWLHKGSLNNIYQSIKNGYPDKGMQSWTVKFNPKEISYLASYIKTLHGTNPANPKPPQGDLYIDNASDSNSIVKKDSVNIVKK